MIMRILLSLLLLCSVATAQCKTGKCGRKATQSEMDELIKKIAKMNKEAQKEADERKFVSMLKDMRIKLNSQRTLIQEKALKKVMLPSKWVAEYTENEEEYIRLLTKWFEYRLRGN